MQIRGLHRSIYRGARLASRLATKERSDVVERRDAVARWRQARRDGLTTEQAAKAVTADPQNKLLHRQNVQRLEAEAIRDAMLLVSGRLRWCLSEGGNRHHSQQREHAQSAKHG